MWPSHTTPGIYPRETKHTSRAAWFVLARHERQTVSIARRLWTCASALGRLCCRGREELLTTQHHRDVGVVTPSHVWHLANRWAHWWLHLYDIMGDADRSVVVRSRSAVAWGWVVARGKEGTWVSTFMIDDGDFSDCLTSAWNQLFTLNCTVYLCSQ